MLSSARYGLPPPPVPRIQAPMARLSISSAATGLIARSPSKPGELLEPHEARDAGEDLRQQQRRGDEGVEEIPAAEAPPHQRDGRRGPDDGGGERGPDRQLGGEPERLHELAALEEVGEPLEREALGRKREVVA